MCVFVCLACVSVLYDEWVWMCAYSQRGGGGEGKRGGEDLKLEAELHEKSSLSPRRGAKTHKTCYMGNA